MKKNKKANEKTKNKKINIYKKVYYSIFKINKYDALSEESMFSAFKYMSNLLLIVATVFACYSVSKMQVSMNNLKSYLNNNLPEMKYEDAVLTVESNERSVLDDKIIVNNFGGQIVIDTTTDYNELVEEYKKSNVPTILLTANQYITIYNNQILSKLEYPEVIKQFLGEDVKKIDKVELLYLFDNFSIESYFFAYLIADFILFMILVIVHGLIISTLLLIVCKFKKLNLKFSKIFKMDIYALTITVFGYILLTFVPKSIYTYLQIIVTLLPLAYLLFYINKKIYGSEDSNNPKA